MSWVGPINPRSVDDFESFANYAQQKVGVPYPTYKDKMIARKAIKEFFAHYPQADWQTLCRVCEYARDKNKRPYKLVSLINLWRAAWGAGALPELDPQEITDPEVEAGIAEALKVERDESWRTRLHRAQGVSGRRMVYEAWLQTKESV